MKRRFFACVLAIMLVFCFIPQINVEAATTLGFNGLEMTHNSRYDGVTIRKGIDVSHWQGDIDWKSVKEYGVEFAIIRMCRREPLTGEIVQDRKAMQNLKGATEAGLKVGVYIYSQAITEAEAYEEADYIINMIGGYQIELPVVMDYEYYSSSSGLPGRLRAANLSKEAKTSIVKAFCERASSRGYTPMIYANKDMLKTQLNASEFDTEYPVWMANWAENIKTDIKATTYAGNYSFWQYSESGHVDGIAGNVDCDFWYDDGTVFNINTAMAPGVTVNYQTHVQGIGWQNPVSNGAVSGTSGQARRLEAIQISIDSEEDLGIRYTTHVQSYGWLGNSFDGEASGTTGEAKRLEAIMMELTGADADKYDLYYRVHAETVGWMAWAKNGEASGTAGYAKRLEAIQIVVMKKGEVPSDTYAGVKTAFGMPYAAADGSTMRMNTTPVISYTTHVQSYGWQPAVQNGVVAGTTGEAKRLEAIKISLTGQPYQGSIEYRTHVQEYGWLDMVPNGQLSGTEGEAKRLEAIQIQLTGMMAEHYDIYYRVHAQSIGWMGWAKNGEMAGTAGYAYRLEAIQIMLVEKDGEAPGSTENAFQQK